VLFTITNHTIGAVFLSQGRPDVQLRWSLVSILLVAVYLATGISWGLFGVVAALSTMEVVGWLVSHRMANRLLQLPLLGFLANLTLPFAASLLFGALLVLLRRLPWWAGAPPSWPALVVWSVAALPLYAAVLHALDRELSRAFWRTLAEVVKTPAAGVREGLP
jgi:hypothetical protein